MHKMAGIYIHIPFCKRRCSYCDFYSTVGFNHIDRYVDCIVKEAQMRAGELHGFAGNDCTIYMGGGTPSLLNQTQFERLIGGIKKTFNIEQSSEFTVEVNPDDVNIKYIEGLIGAGVNRISMGVQSFVDAELQAIGRRHTAAQAITAVDAIRCAGISNVSIDLIYGLPLQTLESWRKSVSMATKLRPQHISAYALSYEEGTPLWHQRNKGEVKETDEETVLEMYRHLTEALKNEGYEHYEISNFALPGFRARHNSSYWNNTPYLGLGAAAHSYDGQLRRYNPADINQYIKAIEAGETCFETEHTTPSEQYDEAVMVQLRTCDGIDLDEIKRRFGKLNLDHLMHEAEPHIAAGRLIITTYNRLRLTSKGIMTSDDIISDLML